MNLKSVCRTCLRTPKKFIYLFQDNDTIIERIKAISTIEIQDIKELSSIICDECVENINNFYNFQKVIRNTNHDLLYRLEMLKKSNYCTKPRSIIKSGNHNSDMSEISVDFKDEKQEIVNSNSYISGLGMSLKTALATKKLFKCHNCNEIFNSKSELYNHRRNKHVASGICNICGIKVRADNLRKHIKLHSEGPCKCDQCDRVLKNSESLRTHKLLHLEDTYTCEICGKTFKLKNEHTRHLKKHQDPDYTKMPCSVCGKKVHNRRKHMLTHTGEKPYCCIFCNKDFSTSYALKVHIRQHTNERPYALSTPKKGWDFHRYI
ncbi:hypothetical protein GWI33_001360 [Rhynchophorus ferrugineus]|uniref:Uncharacterized protein n=1 Tax=Rhynchophorus ferrugineus TaxID=354439 RepID=A0A834HL80_RHYFE|nr:hypothetical protein GWI33_001360 [Rhynchophorus ferrugineus]